LRRTRLRRRIDEILQLVAVGDLIDRRIGTYSGGTKRRVDLAAALVHRPQVVFLDEPTTGLDPDSRARVWSEIQQLNAETGITVFLTTQYLDEADALTDRVGILSHGHLVAEASPEQLKRTVGNDLIIAEVNGENPTMVSQLNQLANVEVVSADGRKVTLRTWRASAVLGQVVTIIHDHGSQLTDLAVRTPTLDDVFRRVTSADHKTEQIAS
jgi:ABC-2 type transport system ATP-binding protein